MKSSLTVLFVLFSVTAWANQDPSAQQAAQPASSAENTLSKSAPAKAETQAQAQTQQTQEDDAPAIQVDRIRSYEARPVATSRERSQQHR